MTIFDNFEQIAGILGRKRFRPPIVDNEKVGFGDLFQQFLVTPVAAGQSQSGE